MTPAHRWLGLAVVVLLAAILITGIVLRIMRRDQTPPAVWALQHWTENILAVQIVLGIIMLVVGRRVIGGPLVWFHYLYGSVFVLVAIIAGRIGALRRERREYVSLAWGAFFALALLMRAIQTACGNEWSAVTHCFTR